MMEWRRGLRDIKRDVVEELCEYWRELAPGWSVNQTGRNNLKKWLRQFSVEELTHAMDVSADAYLDFKQDGDVTAESWETAFSKLPGICRVERASIHNPEIKDLYYVRGIARNNCPNYFDNADALEWLKAARSWDVPMEKLRSIACSARSWTQFRNGVSDAIQYQKELQGYSDEE